MPGPVNVSIVIPAYRAASTLSACIESIASQRFAGSLEVIVVVSGDEDDDLNYADELAPHHWLDVVTHRPRLSAAAGRNLGVKRATGSTLVFTDADVIAEPEWLKALVEATNAKQCAAGAVVNGTPHSSAGTTEYLVEFLELHPGRPPATLWHGATCNLAVPIALFDRYGPFVDAAVGVKEVGSADTTFTLKAASEGNLVFAPLARIVHMNRTDLRVVMSHQVALGRCTAVLARRSQTFPHRRLVQRPWAVPLVVGARWISLWRRLLGWRVGLSLKALLLTPHVLLALGAWGQGLLLENRRLIKEGQ